MLECDQGCSKPIFGRQSYFIDISIFQALSPPLLKKKVKEKKKKKNEYLW